MKNKSLLMGAIVVLIFGAAAFFGGMKYQESKRPQFGQLGNGQGPRGQFQQGAGARQGQGFRPVSGEIISQDDTSITIKLQDGSSKIVLVGDNTAINKSAEGSKSDLTVGEKVAVFGTDNSDGSVTAQNIQLNPQLRGVPSGSQ